MYDLDDENARRVLHTIHKEVEVLDFDNTHTHFVSVDHKAKRILICGYASSFDEFITTFKCLSINIIYNLSRFFQ